MFDFDNAAISRALAQIAGQPTDLADAFFESTEIVELPPESEQPGFRVWCESGLAIRLMRRGQTWLAARDRIDGAAFEDALRRVARALPRAPYPRPSFAAEAPREAPRATELQNFPGRLNEALRKRQLTVSFQLRLRRHRRASQVIGPQVSSGIESERFYSIEIELPDGERYGRLFSRLTEETASQLATAIADRTSARDAAPPATWRGPCVLGPAATAVLLHEAIAHTLEADTLALSGRPEAAIGTRLANPLLTVIDDPASAPENVRRKTDDEGSPTTRRFLLRQGVIEQPLCDRLWAQKSEALVAGAGRRGSRHLPPGPRSTHLELGRGDLSPQDLLAAADGGVYLPEARRGQLDPVNGLFTLDFPYGLRIRDGAAEEPVGRCRLRGHVSDLLGAIDGIGREQQDGGAGWCAKGGIKLPVWANTPALRFEGIPLSP